MEKIRVTSIFYQFSKEIRINWLFILGIFVLCASVFMLQEIPLQASKYRNDPLFVPNTGLIQGEKSDGKSIYMPTVIIRLAQDWPMLAGNNSRTSWTSEEVRGNLYVDWYRPIEPYIPLKIQPIIAEGKIFISTARGLYAFRTGDGQLLWVYPTELPLGHSPTIAKVNGKSYAFVGGYDRKIHAIDTITGAKVSQYTPFIAGAGFETNPLIIDNVIYAGNRDGFFYALDAISGDLIWRFKTNGPILFSAASIEGVVYFASNDGFAYALKTTDGSLVWKSNKFLGAGFHSFWPVIYTDKISGTDYVIFSGSENIRTSDMHLLKNLESDYFFPGCRDISSDPCPPIGSLIGGTQISPDRENFWTAGTSLIDVNTIIDYYEKFPYRRTVFFINLTNGEEVVFDSDNDGKNDYAPFTWSGTTYSGNKYPPIVNNYDGIIYSHTIYASSGLWIPRGDIVGWKPGSKYVSRVEGGSSGHAVDEPMAFSSGGRLIYWSLCCDREMGSFNVTVPYGQPNRNWQYITYNLNTIAPDYEPMYFDGNLELYNSMEGWQVYSGKDSSVNGVYGKHGTTQSPPIPYAGKLYTLKGNTLIAFSPTGSARKLPIATIVASQNPSDPISALNLKERLEAEVKMIIDSGHLRPGYHSAGMIDLFSRIPDSYYHFGEIFDYFQNPAETVFTLIQSLPYLSPQLQIQVKEYLQVYYGPNAPYSFTNIAHVGWSTGSSREVFTIPPDIWTSRYADFGPQTSPFPPFSFYAGWKYAEIFGNPKQIFDKMQGKLASPLDDMTFIQKPHLLNQYIAGYQGYLELQNLAGYSESPSVRNQLSHMLNLRTAEFITKFKDLPPPPEIRYVNPYRALSVSRNFMFMTPELGEYMNKNISHQDLQLVLDEYTYVAPYWFVSKADNSVDEGTLQHLYDSPALFQAKAYVLKQTYNELVKWLDVPAFPKGDLFYIQNIVATLSSSSTP